MDKKKGQRHGRLGVKELDALANVVRRVVLKQTIYRDFEPEELESEAWVAVLRASRLKHLEEGEAYTVIERALIQWKLKTKSVLSIPAGSTWEWGHKRGLIKGGLPLDEALEYPESDWRASERKRDLRIMGEKIYSASGWVERKVTRAIMDGGTTAQVWLDLEDRGVRCPKRAAYQAMHSLREEWRKVL